MTSLTIRLASSLPGRLSIAPRSTTIASGLISSSYVANCSGQTIAAHDALGVFEVEHRVAARAARLRVLRVGELDRREDSAEHDFGAVRQFGRFDRACANSRRPAFLRARPADGSTGRSPALPSPWPTARARSRRARRADWSKRRRADRPRRRRTVPSGRCGGRWRRRAGLHGPIDRGEQLRPAGAEAESNAPALISDSTAVRLTVPGSSRSQKSNRLRYGPWAARSLGDAPWPPPRRSP